MFVKVVDLKETMYSDQTGKFLYLSSKGVRYIMIAYHTNENYISSNPMRNRNEAQMLQTYENIIMRMKTAGLWTKNHVLENEISKEHKASIKANGSTQELLPQVEHRRNIADKFIQTYKNQFVGVLSGLHEYFTMHLWCRLLPQADSKRGCMAWFKQGSYRTKRSRNT